MITIDRNIIETLLVEGGRVVQRIHNASCGTSAVQENGQCGASNHTQPHVWAGNHLKLIHFVHLDASKSKVNYLNDGSDWLVRRD